VALDLKYVKHINYGTAQTGRQTGNESKDNPIYFTLYAAPTAAATQPAWFIVPRQRYKDTSKVSNECNELSKGSAIGVWGVHFQAINTFLSLM